MLICAMLLTAAGVHAQERPLAQRLLQVDEQNVDTVKVGVADTVPPVEEQPTAALEGTNTDTTSTDYVDPDAGAPGSDRMDDAQKRQRARAARNRTALRIGIGIPMGLFTGVWFSF